MLFAEARALSLIAKMRRFGPMPNLFENRLITSCAIFSLERLLASSWVPIQHCSMTKSSLINLITTAKVSQVCVVPSNMTPTNLPSISLLISANYSGKRNQIKHTSGYTDDNHSPPVFP